MLDFILSQIHTKTNFKKNEKCGLAGFLISNKLLIPDERLTVKEAKPERGHNSFL